MKSAVVPGYDERILAQAEAIECNVGVQHVGMNGRLCRGTLQQIDHLLRVRICHDSDRDGVL